LVGRKAAAGQKNGSPSPDSRDVTGDWASLLVHSVKRLESEKDILEQRVAKLEEELENTREEIGHLTKKSEAACQLVLNFSLSDFLLSDS
jgi:hypothetical protein